MYNCIKINIVGMKKQRINKLSVVIFIKQPEIIPKPPSSPPNQPKNQYLEKGEIIMTKAYKGFNQYLQGYGRFQYEVGKTYELDGELEICSKRYMKIIQRW